MLFFKGIGLDGRDVREGFRERIIQLSFIENRDKGVSIFENIEVKSLDMGLFYSCVGFY